MHAHHGYHASANPYYQSQAYAAQPYAHDPYAHQAQVPQVGHPKGMSDLVEFQDENGQIQLMPRYVAMQMGAQHVGSSVRRI
jgi:hypothetical protein